MCICWRINEINYRKHDATIQMCADILGRSVSPIFRSQDVYVVFLTLTLCDIN